MRKFLNNANTTTLHPPQKKLKNSLDLFSTSGGEAVSHTQPPVAYPIPSVPSEYDDFFPNLSDNVNSLRK
jgi:hypothetical protein